MPTTAILDGIGLLTLIGGSVLAVVSRMPKQTIENQKELIESYEKRFTEIERQRQEDVKAHTAERLENVKAIADLQGQIKVYKELPLQDIAASMRELAESNQKILAALEKNT